MLSKPHRLVRRADHLRVLRRGLTFRYPPLSVRVVATGRPTTRFAFIVSNQVSKRATERNRLRRQLREIIRGWLPRIRPGYDIVVSVRPGRGVYSTVQLQQALGRCLNHFRLHT